MTRKATQTAQVIDATIIADEAAKPAEQQMDAPEMGTITTIATAIAAMFGDVKTASDLAERKEDLAQTITDAAVLLGCGAATVAVATQALSAAVGLAGGVLGLVTGVTLVAAVVAVALWLLIRYFHKVILFATWVRDNLEAAWNWLKTKAVDLWNWLTSLFSSDEAKAEPAKA